jgi:hypothetical protein
VIEARRLAQIGVFLLGLANLPSLILGVVTFTSFGRPGGELDWPGMLVAFGHVLFVLSLLLASGAWAALVDASGSVSRLADFRYDDFLRAAVPILGLYLLLTGVADVVGSVVQWLFVRGSGGYEGARLWDLVPSASVVRALCGAVLVGWGSSVAALIRWAQGLGRSPAE